MFCLKTWRTGWSLVTSTLLRCGMTKRDQSGVACTAPETEHLWTATESGISGTDRWSNLFQSGTDHFLAHTAVFLSHTSLKLMTVSGYLNHGTRIASFTSMIFPLQPQRWYTDIRDFAGWIPGYGKSIHSLSLSPTFTPTLSLWSQLIIPDLNHIRDHTRDRFPTNMAMGHHCLSQVRPRILEALVETPPRLEEVKLKKSTDGYGSIPIDTFLVGWTSIYQLFWGSLGTRVLTHPQIYRYTLAAVS